MTAYIGRRLLALIPLLLIISAIVFGLTFLIPGDPARALAGFKAPQLRVVLIRHQLGLDRPIVIQYLRWLGHAVRGNLGTSLLKNSPVAAALRARLPVTLSMALGGLAVTVLIGVPVGILAGTRPGAVADKVATVGTSAAIAVPDFWLAMVLVVVFAVKLHWLPAIGYVGITQSPVAWASHLYMAWIALGLNQGAALARQVRSSLIDVLDQDYIRTAAAKGLRRRTIIGKHALKNAAIVPLTLIGIQFAYLLGGTIILENIFSAPGLGQYFFLALNGKDLPVIQGVILVVALTFVLVNLAVDVLYAYVNPKVRLT